MRSLAFVCVVAVGCGLPLEGELVEPLQFEKAFNTISIVNTKSLLKGHHQAFDAPAQATCVRVLGDAKPAVDGAGEAFDLEYKESKQELRSFFNLTAQAQANLLLIHAKGTVELADSLNQDDVALFFGLHAYQYYSTSYDAKSLALTDDTVKRMENKDGLALDDVAKQQLFQCGAGYLRKLMVGGELDVVLEITASNYLKTSQLKKSLEVSGIAGNAKWYSDSKITDQLGGVTVKVKVYAAGFEFKGAAITSALAESYIQGQIDSAAKGAQNTVIAAVTAMQTVHTALKASVTKDQNSDQSCTKVMVFQGVLGNYFSLENVPAKCGPDSIVKLQNRTNELADLMGTQSLAFETAEQSCSRAVSEIETFYKYRASGLPKGALYAGFGFEPQYHQHGLANNWCSYSEMTAWTAPYYGWWGAAFTGEFHLANDKGLRRVALDYYKSIKSKLSDKTGTAPVIDSAIEDPTKMKVWRMLVQNPNTWREDWGTRQYNWKEDTWLRNLYTYINRDRVRPVYVLQNKKDVKGADIKSAAVTCDAGGRFPAPLERFPLAQYIDLPGNDVPTQNRAHYIWMDPAVKPRLGGACDDKSTPAGIKSWAFPVPDRTKGPVDADGIFFIICMPTTGDKPLVTNLVCVPTDQGVFGGTNPFAL